MLVYNFLNEEDLDKFAKEIIYDIFFSNTYDEDFPEDPIKDLREALEGDYASTAVLWEPLEGFGCSKEGVNDLEAIIDAGIWDIKNRLSKYQNFDNEN